MIKMPAEFEKQSFVQLIFPHKESDWIEYLEEARECFVNIALNIAKFQSCLIICDDIEEVKSYFTNLENLYFIHYQSDDTWARDCSALSVEKENSAQLIDFTFNGWGDKFEAKRDNNLTQNIKKIYASFVLEEPFILEGGSIESDGEGIILTTTQCLLNPNRNSTYNKEAIEDKLSQTLGAKKILWLNHGTLEGDDTDAHIDTLARLVSNDCIMYVECTDKKDSHYDALLKMKTELSRFKNLHNESYKLIALPHPEAIYFEKERLPATYANFLIINGAILVPTYSVKEDKKALEIFKKTFPLRKIIPIDCSILIRQHGSLHCVTMQFPKSVILKSDTI